MVNKLRRCDEEIVDKERHRKQRHTAKRTRSMHQTPYMIEQHNLLSWVANKIDAGRIRTTVSQVLSPINAANMREAHRLVETGQAKEKIVIEGFYRTI